MPDGSLCKGIVSETTCTGTKLSVEVDGTKPEAGGTILIQNGRVVNELTVQNAEGEDEVKQHKYQLVNMMQVLMQLVK